MSNNPEKNIFEKELEMWIRNSKRIVIAGIGNPLRRDDYVGVKVVRELQNKVSKLVFLIECGNVPENFIGQIIEFKPTHVLLIDAALLNASPGTVKLIAAEEISNWPPVSTHALPLRIFCDYIAETTGAEVALIAIQPENADFGEGLTEAVEKTARDLTDLLLKLLP